MLLRAGLFAIGLGASAVSWAAGLSSAASEGLARDVSTGELIYRMRMLVSGDSTGISQYGVVCERPDGQHLSRSTYLLNPENGSFESLSWRSAATQSELELERSSKRWVARRRGEHERERVSYPKIRNTDVLGWVVADVLRQRLSAIRERTYDKLTHVEIPSLKRQSYRVSIHSFWRAEHEIQLVQLSASGWFSSDKPAMSFEFAMPSGRLLRYKGPSLCLQGDDQPAQVDMRF